MRAAADGVVTFVGRRGEYGNHVQVRHSNGSETGYSQLSQFTAGVAPGTCVSGGDTIGFLGATGLTYTPNLHFEVVVNGIAIDPMTVLPPRQVVERPSNE